MQDIHSIGGSGRLFSGGRQGGGGGGRGPEGSTAPQPAPPAQPPGAQVPAVRLAQHKFCYYNNYNLSQPRHFCKSCRRYWTKGGVLRNVPVGGGCRKAKRSKSKPYSDASAPPPPQRERKSNSHTSSESSSLTASNTAATEAVSAVTEVPSLSSASTLLKVQDSKLFTPNPSFEPAGLLEQQASGLWDILGDWELHEPHNGVERRIAVWV
ncbi:hypothetical protein SLA2020_436300 [Shorea laevis]